VVKSKRTTEKTAFNEISSRSHCFLILNVNVEKDFGTYTTKYSSRLNLIDLAGSEKTRDANAINPSLSHFSNVVN